MPSNTNQNAEYWLYEDSISATEDDENGAVARCQVVGKVETVVNEQRMRDGREGD